MGRLIKFEHMEVFDKLDSPKFQFMDESELECAKGGHPNIRFNHWHVNYRDREGKTVLQRYSWWGRWGTRDTKTVKDE